MTAFESRKWRAGSRGGRRAVAGFADAVLRGVGQVMLQDNRWTGLFFVLGIAWQSVVLAAVVLFATAVATATAIAWGADPGRVRAGLYGFNGALVAVALWGLAPPLASVAPLALLLWIALGAAGSSVLAAALQRLLDRWELPVLTAPFVFVTWVLVYAALAMGWGAAGAPAEVAAGSRTALGLAPVAAYFGVAATTVLKGVAQVFLQDGAVTGALFLVGLALSSRRVAVLALAGSTIGAAVGWCLGMPDAALRAGIAGFNGVLAAIALGGALRPGWRSSAWLLAALALAPAVTLALAKALAPLGLAPLTFPFVLVTWAVLRIVAFRGNRTRR